MMWIHKRRQEENVCVKLQKSVLIMDSEYKILYLSARWTQQNADSLRFYYLGEKYKNKVEHIGAKPGFDVTDTLIL